MKQFKFYAWMLFCILLSINQVWATDDVLTRVTTGVDNGATSYSDWSNKTATSSAVYAGNSAGSNDAIQLRTTNSNSGVVTTTSGGKAKKVTVEWQSSTTNGRTLDVYGKSTAYSAASDLYNSTNQGSKLGSIVKGTSTELTITGDYEYIGFRSNSGAMYLTSITIEWETGATGPTYTDYLTECAPAAEVTAVSNNESWGTVSVSGTTITANPKQGYRVVADAGGYTVTAGTTTVAHEGNSNTLTVTPSTDCTVRINFEAIPMTTINWMIGGSAAPAGSQTTSIATGSQYKDLILPTAPADNTIGDCADHFMGWSTSNLGTTLGQSAPAVLFKSVAGNETEITGSEVTFYAVFATGGGDVALNDAFAGRDPNNNATIDLNNVTKTINGVSYSFAKNTAETPPGQTKQTTGRTSYPACIRLYYKNSMTVSVTSGTITQIVLTKVDGSNVVTANVGTFNAETQTWTGNASSVTFTIGVDASKSAEINPSTGKAPNESGHNKYTNISVTTSNGGGGAASDYVTMCVEPDKRIYLKTFAGWDDSSAKTALYDATNNTWVGLMNQGTGCYAGYLYLDVPSSCNTIVFGRFSSDEANSWPISGWNYGYEGNPGGFWNKSQNFDCTTNNLYTLDKSWTDNVANGAGSTLALPTYTLTFDANGHGTAPEAISDIECGSMVEAPADPEETGYSFVGWYTDRECTDANRWDFATNDVTETRTLYAKWNVKSYTLTWDFDGGSTSATEGSEYTAGGSVAFGADITYPADNTMSKEGYHFTGWSSTPATMSAGNLTLTAQWEINSYDVKWYVNGVEYENGGSTSVNHGAAMSTLTLPTAPADNALSCKDKFMGWSETDLGKADGQDAPSDLFTSVAGKATVITEAKEFYAVFADAEGSPESWSEITSVPDAGTYAILCESYFMKASIASNRFENGAATPSISDGKLSAVPAEDCQWVFSKPDEYYRIMNGTNYAGGTNSKNQGALLADASADLAKWSISYVTDHFEIINYGRSKASTDNANKYLRNNSTNGWATYASGTGSAPRLFKKTGATYSNYVTKCCTTLAAPTNLQSVGLSEGITMTWDAAANATGYQIEWNGDTDPEHYINVNATTYTVNDLLCGGGTDYSWRIRAIYSGAGDYCSESDWVAGPSRATTYCSCYNYSFHYGTKDNDADWNTGNPVCFEATEISDGNSGVYYFSRNFTMPNKSHYYVGWTGNWNTEIWTSSTDALSGMPFFHMHGSKTLGTISDGSNVGAIGTLCIRSSYNDNNKYIDFIPGGYVLKIGESYNSYAFHPTVEDNVLETVWTTDLMMLNEDMLTHNIQVLLKTASGSVWSPNMSSNVAVNGHIGQKSGAETWGTNLSAADAGKTGKFRIWADNTAANWNVHFVPFVQATFDANGGSCATAALPAERVSVEAEASARTITLPEATKIGHSLLWSDGANTYAAGTEVELTADKAFTAQWTAESYGITYHLNEGAWNGAEGAANYIYGTGVGALADNVERENYRFDGWFDNDGLTGDAVTTIAADALGAKEFWAKWTRVYTITYTIPSSGGSLAGGYAETVANGETFTMPNVTGIDGAYECETFIGWTTTAPTTANGWENEAKPAIFYQAGETSPVITDAPVLYAVYSRPGCGEAGTASLTTAMISAWAGATNHGYGNSRDAVDAAGRTWTTTGYQQSASDTYIQLNAANTNYILMPIMPGNIRTITAECRNGQGNDLSSGSLYLKVSNTDNDAIATHTFNLTDKKNTATFDLTSGEYTGGYITASGTTRITSITVEYGPAPVVSHALSCASCAVEQFSLTYDANTANFSGSNITCSNETDYVFAEHDNEYTICDGAGEWTGWKFVEWNTQADGNGTSYTAGQVITPASLATDEITLYAIWERVYDVTFHDAGVDTKLTQEHNGSEVSVPVARLTSPMTFVGWTTDSKVLQGEIVKPTIALAADAENYTPTADVELYAVYKKTAASSAFAEKTAGTTFAVKIHDAESAGNYAKGSIALDATGSFTDGTSAEAAIFYITYVGDGSNESKIYTIQTENGYLNSVSSSSLDFKTESSPKNWTITENSGKYQVVGDNRYFAHGSGFKNYGSSGYIYFETADGTYYWSNQPHAINLSATTNGSIAVQGGLTEAAEGSTVTVIATQEPGYALQSWSFSGDASHGSLTEYTTTFVMGTTDVTVGATFERAAQVTATFYVNGVEHSHQTVYQGESITLPTGIASTDDDYVTFLGWSDGEQFTGITAEPEILTGTKQLNATKNYYAVFTDMVVSRAIASGTSGTDVLVTSGSYPNSEMTKIAGGVEYKYSGVLSNNNAGVYTLQFRGNAETYGRIYNTTSLGRIIKVEVAGSDVPVFACSSSGTTTGSALVKQGTPIDPRTYTMPAGTEFFMIKGNSTMYRVDYLKVYYLPNGGSQHYTTNFCEKKSISVTPVSGATLTASKDASCAGKTITVTATLNPGNEFGGWTSSDVTFADASALTTTFTMPDQAVTISATINSIKMTGMTLNQTNVVWSEWKSDAVAPSQQLSVTSTTPAVVGDNTVTWSVTSGSAVTVSATGLVTAVEAGTATVTATANDGSGVTASCTFTVPEKTYPVSYADPTGLTLKVNNSATKKQYFVAGATVALSASEKSGYGFVEWNVIGATPADVTAKSTSFTMPTQAVTVSATAEEKEDTYIDDMHNYDTRTRRGANYTVPTLSDKNTGNGCETGHYHFVGWIEAQYLRADGTISDTNAGRIFFGGTRDASGKTYYAIWAEEAND